MRTVFCSVACEEWSGNGITQIFQPGIDAWALSNALLDRHLGESNSAALGGDIAYQYGVAGNLGALDASASQAVLGDKALGSQMQALRPTSALQDGIKLA